MAKQSFQIVNYGALGAGSIAAGVAAKLVPIQQPQIKAAIPVILGVFLSRMKSEPVKFLGYGMISRGVGDLANTFGIGEELIASSLDETDLSEELIAEELEEELIAAEMSEFN